MAIEENIAKFIRQNEAVLKKAKELCASVNDKQGTLVIVSEYIAEITALFTSTLTAFVQTTNHSPFTRKEFVDRYLNEIKAAVLKDDMN